MHTTHDPSKSYHTYVRALICGFVHNLYQGVVAHTILVMKALSGPFLGGGFGKALADTLLVFKDFIHYSSPECHIKFPNPESCIIMTRSGSQLASVSTKQLRLRTRFCLVNLHLHIPVESTHARAPHVSIISCSKSNRFIAISEDYRFDLGDAAADYSLSELYDEFISSAIFVGQPIHAPASAYAQKQLVDYLSE